MPCQIFSSDTLRIAISRTAPSCRVTVFQGARQYHLNLRPAAGAEDTAYVAEYRLSPDGGLPMALSAPDAFFKAVEPTWTVPQGKTQQRHFHPVYGWLNDPNGLFSLDGQWHLFYQYNPLGVTWENMHWGHAVSADLKNWRNLPISLYPDEYGMMYSGSAVVDENDAAGFGKDAILLFYTNCDTETHMATQCLAVSTDRGRTFTKYKGGLPIIGNITGSTDRDPNIAWDERAGVWRMALYFGTSASKSSFGLFESRNLVNWTPTDVYDIPEGAECPGIRPMTDEVTGERRWLFTEASGRYRLGDISATGKVTFDGGVRRFLYGVYYAGQSYFGTQNGKTVYLSWLRMAPSPERQWTGCLSTPMELRLKGGELLVRPLEATAAFETGGPEAFLDAVPAGAAGHGRVVADTFSTEYFDDSQRFAVAVVR